MKITKTLVLLGMVGCSSAASAQSYLASTLSTLPEFNGSVDSGGVSLYGSVDMGINYQRVSNRSLWQSQSGGEWTSKFGIFGREDLGGGLKAEFNLESGFLANNGNLQTTSQLFNREAWVGLSSNTWGQVRFGNQYGVALPLFVDVFGGVGTNSVYTWLGAGVTQTAKGTVSSNADLGTGSAIPSSRIANSVTWTTPRVAGVGAELLYAFNNSTTVSSPHASTQGAIVSWLRGPLYLAGSYTQVWSDAVTVTTGQPTTTVRNDLFALGAVYDVGSFVLSAAFNEFVPKLATDGIARVYTLGGILPVGRNVFRLSVVYRDTSGVHDSAGQLAKDSAIGLMAGYDYTLSKRTALYARAGFIRNFGISSVILNSNTLPTQSGSTAPELGTTPMTASVGIYHNF